MNKDSKSGNVKAAKTTNATSSGERWEEVKLWDEGAEDDQKSLSTNARFRLVPISSGCEMYRSSYKPIFRTAYMPDYFGGQMSEREKDYDWNMFMGRPMSEQHKFVTKIKMFVQNR